ncbi:MAG: flagellar export chaperone FliS [Tepidanaerobacteraceae bacterium]|jgi:flagellar protein FliS
MMNAYQQYKMNSVMLASPEKLLIMMYDGIIRFIEAAKESLRKKDIKGAHKNILRAQDLVTELNMSLDMEHEVSMGLSRIYDFLHSRLVDANIKKDIAILEEIEPIVKEMKETWLEAISNKKESLVK